MADKGIPALTAADRLDGTRALSMGSGSTNFPVRITTLKFPRFHWELKSVPVLRLTLLVPWPDANTYIQDNATWLLTLTVSFCGTS